MNMKAVMYVVTMPDFSMERFVVLNGYCDIQATVADVLMEISHPSRCNPEDRQRIIKGLEDRGLIHLPTTVARHCTEASVSEVSVKINNGEWEKYEESCKAIFGKGRKIGAIRKRPF